MNEPLGPLGPLQRLPKQILALASAQRPQQKQQAIVMLQQTIGDAEQLHASLNRTVDHLLQVLKLETGCEFRQLPLQPAKAPGGAAKFQDASGRDVYTVVPGTPLVAVLPELHGVPV